jgi:sterol desaturase/sphingolipid hydroxylase (fatty acid hydroxylase superfamily)
VDSAKAEKSGFWNRSHHLDRMTFNELVVAYFQYPAIIAYLSIALLSVGIWFKYPAPLLNTLGAVVFAIMAYPLVWYTLHRWVLHSNWMFKVPFLYDHHQDPNHLEVLFGALHTTLPTIAIATAPVGYLIGGTGGAFAALATGLFTTAFYEFCHCIQHLAYKPKAKFLVEMKARHMEHHFHDENGNFGITSFVWDKLFGTYYLRPDRPEKSEKVFNLGYNEEVALRYPKVKELSGGVIATGHPRQRLKG